MKDPFKKKITTAIWYVVMTMMPTYIVIFKSLNMTLDKNVSFVMMNVFAVLSAAAQASEHLYFQHLESTIGLVGLGNQMRKLKISLALTFMISVILQLSLFFDVFKNNIIGIEILLFIYFMSLTFSIYPKALGIAKNALFYDGKIIEFKDIVSYKISEGSRIGNQSIVLYLANDKFRIISVKKGIMAEIEKALQMHDGDV